MSLDPFVECGQHEQREQGRTDEPTGDHRGQRFLNFAAGAIGEEQRQQSQAGRDGGHEHRPQSPARRFN